MPARTDKKPSNLNTNVKASAAAGEVSNKVVDKKTKVNPVSLHNHLPNGLIDATGSTKSG